MISPAAQAATDLIAAAEAGRTREVEALIAKGTDLEARDPQGRTALLLAVAGNHVAALHARLVGHRRSIAGFTQRSAQP